MTWLRTSRLRALAVAVASLALSLGLGEAIVRLLGDWDARGQFLLRGQVLPPRRLPIEATRQAIEQYESSQASDVVYDPVTGWTPRPNYLSVDGLYRFDARGVRVATRGSVTRDRSGHRIGLFGDSFALGAEVPFRRTFGDQLEQRLRADGWQARVSNFGVVGYGMDQALLRFRHHARDSRIDVVVFGFQPENVRRNLNLIRSLYFEDTGLPFTKPRFVLAGDRLELVNVPALAPSDLVETLLDLPGWELAEHEHYYDPSQYRDLPWRASKLAALAEWAIRSDDEARDYAPDGEAGRLALRILADFESEARQAGARFLVIHLPRRRDLAALRRDERFGYQALLEEIDARFKLVRPESALLGAVRARRLASLFAERNHYGALAHRIVAEEAISAVAEALTDSGADP